MPAADQAELKRNRRLSFANMVQRWTVVVLAQAVVSGSAAPARRFEPGGWGAFPAVAVSPDPNDGSVMLAGADVGGLFGTIDGGVTWTQCGQVSQLHGSVHH